MILLIVTSSLIVNCIVLIQLRNPIELIVDFNPLEIPLLFCLLGLFCSSERNVKGIQDRLINGTFTML